MGKHRQISHKIHTMVHLEEWKETWMAKTQGDAVFVSAIKKQHMDAFRNRLYQKVRELHITRFPYNHFLYPEIEIEQ